MAQEWQELEPEADNLEARKAELGKLTSEIVPYLMEHNTEAEACDLLMEVEKIGELEQYVDENAHARVCLYLKRFVMAVFSPRVSQLSAKLFGLFHTM